MPARVLIVEDNAANLDLMRYLLLAAGYEVCCERDGIAALERLKNEAFDLVLTDILMPTLDGYELARRFKSDPRLRDVPLIAVTALAMPGDEPRILSAGFDGYIAKPIEPASFPAHIAAFLR